MLKGTSRNIVCNACNTILNGKPYYTVRGKLQQVLHYCPTHAAESGHIPAAVFSSPALKKRSQQYPDRFGDRVPLVIRMTKTVVTDLPFVAFDRSIPLAIGENEYYCTVNSYGAVAAIGPEGEQLGVKPNEFEVVAWHPTYPTPATHAHPGS
jgi:hypothetical protein